MQVVAEVLVQSDWALTQEASQLLLQTLALRNPGFQPLVSQTLVDLLASSSPPTLQRIVCTLRTVQVGPGSRHVQAPGTSRLQAPGTSRL